VQRDLDRGLGAMVAIHATVHCSERTVDIIGIATHEMRQQMLDGRGHTRDSFAGVHRGLASLAPADRAIVGLDPHQHISGAPDFLARHHHGFDHRQADRDRLDCFDLHAGNLGR
jgi:hypothetical protein